MEIIEILIIGLVAVFLIAILATMFSGKRQKKPKKSKIERTLSKGEEKPAQESAKQDRTFNIVKKGRLSRISKKALQTNARSATVERVFERTPPMTQTAQEDIYIDPLNPESEKLLKEYESINFGKEKVVSFKELKLRAQEAETISQTDEEYSSANFITSRNQSGKTGVYGQFHVGDHKSTSFDLNEDSKDNLSLKEQSFMEFVEKRRKEKSELAALKLSSFSDVIDQESQTQETLSGDIDYSDVVIAEALLNPKYKQIKNNKPKK